MIDVPSAFLSFLRNEEQRGVDSELNDARATAIEFYQGKPFGNEEEGRSQAVTRDVSEVVDQMTVGILNAVLASGKAVEFETEAEQATDENGQPMFEQSDSDHAQDGVPEPIMVDYGEQATHAVQYQFFRKQPGYAVLRDAVQAGLLEKSGIVKSYAMPQRPALHTFDVGGGEIGPDNSYQGAEIVDAKPLDDGVAVDEPSTQWRITVLQPRPPLFRDVAVPNEYFRVSGDATCLDEALCVGERVPKTLSDLVAMGYDPDVIRGLYGAGGAADTVVETARDSSRSNSRNSSQRGGDQRTLWLSEQYPLYDLDGDGIAERLFVHRIGDTVLKVMPVDEQPYSLWCPFPMAHRLIGESAADKTMDIQAIRSVLLRQGLDSLYTSNNPRAQIDENAIGENTIDDWMTPGPQVLIRTKGAGITPFPGMDTSPSAFNAMEMVSNERASRTGVTPQSKGIEPNALNKTASGLAMNLAQSQQIELYAARNFTEMLLASMFQKRYRLMREHGTPFRMKIEGEYQTVDPRKWPEDIDVTINVGLGTGNRDQRLGALSALMDRQGQALQGGLRIFTEENLYQTGRKFIAESGIGTPSNFITDPSKLPPPEPQPDPQAQKDQAAAMIQAHKAQSEHDQAMARIELQRHEHDVSARLKSEAAQASLDAMREKSALEAQLARDRAEFEATLAQQTADRQFALQQEQLARDAALHAMRGDVTLPKDRPGGSLSQ